LKKVFVDAAFWVSFINPENDYYELTPRLAKKFELAAWVTTDAVLWETLSFYSRFSPAIRVGVAQTLEALYNEPHIDIITGGRNWLIASTEFYRKRKDKAWSGVDCFSMLVMESKGIRDVLTTDHHFRQAGFNALMLEE
jgi:uncharacterized protein